MCGITPNWSRLVTKSVIKIFRTSKIDASLYARQWKISKGLLCIMKQCTNPWSTEDATESHATTRTNASTMTATTAMTSGTTTSTSTTMSTNAKSKNMSASSREPKSDSKTSGGKSASDLHPSKPQHQQPQQQYLQYPHHYPLHQHPLGTKMSGKLGTAGVDSLSALHMLPVHLRDMFLAAQLLRGKLVPVRLFHIKPHTAH